MSDIHTFRLILRVVLRLLQALVDERAVAPAAASNAAARLAEAVNNGELEHDQDDGDDGG